MWKQNVTVEGVKWRKTHNKYVFSIRVCWYGPFRYNNLMFKVSSNVRVSWNSTLCHNLCHDTIFLTKWYFFVIFLSLLQGLPQADTKNQLSATLVMFSCILLTILSTNTAQLTLWMKKLAAKGMLLFQSWQLSVIYWTWVVCYWTLCVTDWLTHWFTHQLHGAESI